MRPLTSTRLFAKLCVVGIVLFALGISALSLALPAPSGLSALQDYRRNAAGISFFAGLSFGTAIFLLQLQGFRPAFKRSYYLICGGLAAFSSSAVLYPTTQALSGNNIALPRLAGSISFLLGALLMYIGVRRFGQLLQVKNRWLSIWRFVIIGAILAIGAGALPISQQELSTPIFHILHGVGAIEALSYFAVASLIWTIRANASAAYSKALGWFWLATAPLAIMHTLFIVSDYFAHDLLIAIAGAVLLASHVPLLLMSYNLYRTSQGGEQPVTEDGNNGTVDIIVYTASLASKPAEIDPILDSLRRLTAEHGRDAHPFNAEEEKTLEGIYSQLETYLTTQEPLRSYTRDSLHTLLVERFGHVPQV